MRKLQELKEYLLSVERNNYEIFDAEPHAVLKRIWELIYELEKEIKESYVSPIRRS